MEEKINPQLTILLGFLTEKQWVEAIKEYGVEKEFARELLQAQDYAYESNLEKSVFEQL